MQKNFEGKLIGADRAKDLAVLKVNIILRSMFCSKMEDSYVHGQYLLSLCDHGLIFLVVVV